MDIELGLEMKANTELKKENRLLKSLLYCATRSCNNCGKVTCENFQRQRIDCCGNWVSYKDYIKQLEEENTRLATNEKSLLAERKIIAKENTEAKNLIEELASSLSVVGECGEEECELINKAQKFINKPIF